ncbi:MAG: hypothetical protein V1913_00970 [Fibrobacterota bacterium]
MIARRFAALLFALITGCGLNPSGESALEVTGSYPADGDVNTRAYGRYYFVFNSAIAPSSSDEINLSFSARLTASGATLYVERLDAPAFDRADTMEIRTLSRPGGGPAGVLYKIAFRTAPGEHEDNGTLVLADTLRPGRLLDGVCGNSDAAPSDNDWYVVTPTGNDSFEVTVSLLDSLPALCVRFPDYRVTDLGKTAPVLIRGNDTLRFFLTNRYTISGQTVQYARNAWYRISVKSL